jgi:hypothetical protein
MNNSSLRFRSILSLPKRTVSRLGADCHTAANWKFAAQSAMATLAQLALPYAHRFQSLLEVAPPEDVPLVRFMVDHALSACRIAERKARGESTFSSELFEWSPRLLEVTIY